MNTSSIRGRLVLVSILVQAVFGLPAGTRCESVTGGDRIRVSIMNATFSDTAVHYLIVVKQENDGDGSMQSNRAKIYYALVSCSVPQILDGATTSVSGMIHKIPLNSSKAVFGHPLFDLSTDRAMLRLRPSGEVVQYKYSASRLPDDGVYVLDVDSGRWAFSIPIDWPLRPNVVARNVNGLIGRNGEGNDERAFVFDAWSDASKEVAAGKELLQGISIAERSLNYSSDEWTLSDDRAAIYRVPRDRLQDAFQFGTLTFGRRSHYIKVQVDGGIQIKERPIREEGVLHHVFKDANGVAWLYYNANGEWLVLDETGKLYSKYEKRWSGSELGPYIFCDGENGRIVAIRNQLVTESGCDVATSASLCCQFVVWDYINGKATSCYFNAAKVIDIGDGMND